MNTRNRRRRTTRLYIISPTHTHTRGHLFFFPPPIQSKWPIQKRARREKGRVGGQIAKKNCPMGHKIFLSDFLIILYFFQHFSNNFIPYRYPIIAQIIFPRKYFQITSIGYHLLDNFINFIRLLTLSSSFTNTTNIRLINKQQHTQPRLLVLTYKWHRIPYCHENCSVMYLWNQPNKFPWHVANKNHDFWQIFYSLCISPN